MRGFTLIELSIVLVIIGLIVGGVLVGQDLIRAAEVRAQVTQIEKYNTAVNTFRGTYGYLPGDMTIAAAQQFGFTVGTACTGIQGARDGNGLIQGWNGGVLQVQGQGETELFWQDLTSPALGSSLIDGTFPNSGQTQPSCASGSTPIMTATSLSTYLPVAKIGCGNFVYVYSNNGLNYFSVSALTSTTGPGAVTSLTTIPVIHAYNIDKKVDDGLPAGGNVQTNYLSGYIFVDASPSTAISGGTSSTCYDTTTNTYSITLNGGAGPNCALSFQMQGAAR